MAVLVVTLRPRAPAHWPTASDPYSGAVAENRGRWTKPKVQWTPIPRQRCCWLALPSSCSFYCHICTLSLSIWICSIWLCSGVWFWGKVESFTCPFAKKNCHCSFLMLRHSGQIYALIDKKNYTYPVTVLCIIISAPPQCTCRLQAAGTTGWLEYRQSNLG